MANVLIIDDDESVSALLHSQLTEEGHTVRIAGDGQEGMSLLSRFKPDLVMLDVFLPDSTGFQICGQLRKHELTRSTPIIMMTGAARFSTQQLIGFQKGANEYIFKPFNIAEVDQLIHKYIGGQGNGHATNVADVPIRFEDPRAKLDAMAGGSTMNEPKKSNHLEDVTMMLDDYLNRTVAVEQPRKEKTAEALREILMPSPDGNGHIPVQGLRNIEITEVEPMAPIQEEAAVERQGGFVPSVLASKERFIELGVEIMALTARLSANQAEKHVSEHLLRTSLGVGQKLTECRMTTNSKDYMALLQGALKDIRETGYWLMLVRKAGLLDLLKKPEALEKTCQSLTTLLTDFVSNEKKRFLA